MATPVYNGGSIRARLLICIGCMLCAQVSGSALAFPGDNADGVLITSSGTAGCTTISLHPDTLPDGIVGDPYSAMISADGGTPPYVFTSTSSLPFGLSLSPDGLLAGTPTFPATYGFPVFTTDSAGCSGFTMYRLLVSEPYLPDLLGDILDLRVPGRKLLVSFWCYNEGPKDAGPFRLRLFLSKDRSHGKGDQIVSVMKVPGLASKSVSSVMKVKFTARKKFRNLVLQVDFGEAVAEIDESNNFDYKEILWRSVGR
ncbi:MAG: hypothetical protein HYX75_03085 [Acidobacteria bacterium]|nr:hypothetical protein [Acidobacteriota bacterium]